MKKTLLAFLVVLVILLAGERSWGEPGVIVDYSFNDLSKPWEKNTDGTFVRGRLTTGNCPGKTYDLINADGNYSQGSGGMGYRYAVRSGSNHNGCVLSIDFGRLETHIWARWYVRYSRRIGWKPLIYDKFIYFRKGSHSGGMNMSIGEEYGRIVLAYGPGLRVRGKSGRGWKWINGGSKGDGKWHLFECEACMDSNHSNGVVRFWVDGELVLENNSVDYSSHGKGWRAVFIPSNQGVAKIKGGGTAYVDIDDVKVVNENYTGFVSVGGYRQRIAP
jgi:hypothetical protein